MRPYVFNPLQPYLNRDYRLSDLDDATFEAWNQGLEGCFLQVSGCLDALDSIPAGSCTSSPRGTVIGPSYIQRGYTWAEIQEQEDLIEELLHKLQEERKT